MYSSYTIVIDYFAISLFYQAYLCRTVYLFLTGDLKTDVIMISI